MSLVSHFIKKFLTLSCFLSIPLLGIVDYYTGPDLSFSIFYLVPISLVVWYSERQYGLVTAFASAATWLAADLMWRTPDSSPTIHYWNAIVRLGFFSIVVFLLSQVKTLNQGLEAKVEERTKRLGRNEHLLRLFVENSPAAIAMFDREMRYIVASRRYLIDYELGNQNIVGHSHYEIFPEIPERWKEIHRRCLAGGIERAEEDPFQRASGKLDWVRWEIRPWHETNDEVGGIILFSEVITERKQAENQIRQQIDRLTALRKIDRSITSSFDLIATLDTILEPIITQLNVDAADVLLLDSDEQVLNYAAGRGFHTSAIETTRVPVGESNAGRVAQEHRMIKIEDLINQPDDPLLTTLLGSEGFVCYYGIPLIAKGKVKGVLEVFNRAPINPSAEWFDFLDSLAKQTAIAIENVSLFENLEQTNRELIDSYDVTIEGWSRALDLRDEETEGHTLRVTELTLDLARQFDFTDDQLKSIRWGALLHDIGKMGVPDSILLKPDQLTEEEWAIMKQHPTFAFEMLSPIAHLKLSLEIPYSHHEKWDGTGYPLGLKGEQIPLSARIFAVVDVWDAITSNRPYRPAWDKEKALAHIQEESGKYFDPRVVDAFMKMVNPA